MEKWNNNPQEKQANIAWQVAYKDSFTIFRLKLDITPAQVLLLLQDYNIRTGAR